MIGCEPNWRQAATNLESAANALHRFASKMEHVNELRRQSQQLEQESWQITGDTPDDLHHRQNLAHRAYQLRHEADWEANTADSLASNEFDMMMSEAQHIMESVGQLMSRTLAEDRRDAAYESYYARHRDLFEVEDEVDPMTMGGYKRADYEGVNQLQERHSQLVAQAREIIKRRDVPGYITNPEEIERVVEENFQAECGRPQNHGFEGEPVRMTLETGTLIDRYGDERGSFFSPEGIPYKQRALALHSDKADYHVYRVLAPLEVGAGKIAPWFGREGGATSGTVRRLKIFFDDPRSEGSNQSRKNESYIQCLLSFAYRREDCDCRAATCTQCIPCHV